jgi:hypothetical protein
MATKTDMSTGKPHDEFETQHIEKVSVPVARDDDSDRHPYVPELIHLHDIAPRGRTLLQWERARHSHARWFVECLAEAVRGLRRRA